MTSWQDPPLTRREARERERRAAAEANGQGSRRAGTTEPTTAGEEPRLSRAQQADSRPESRHESATPDGASESTRLPALPTEITARTLTRRQLRAMLQAQEAERLAAAGQAPQESEPEAASESEPKDASESQPGAVSESELEPEQEQEQEQEPAPEQELEPEQEQEPAAETASDSDALPRFTVVPEIVTDDGAVLEGTVLDEVSDETVIEAQIVETGPTETQAPASQAQDAPLVVAEHQEPTQTPVPVQNRSTDVVDPDSRHNPAVHDTGGHSREASALILPVIPSLPDATGPLTRTGEILVTGSIDLPRSLGATGQHPNRFDSADMDRAFDSETDPNTSTVEPIRASRAVSTHASTREMITPVKKTGTHLPVILAVTASVLLIGVIALVVAGFVFGVF